MTSFSLQHTKLLGCLFFLVTLWSCSVLVVSGRSHHTQQAHHHHSSKSSSHHHHHHHHRNKEAPVVAPIAEDDADGGTPAEIDLSSFRKDENDDTDEDNTGGVQLLAEQESPVLEPAGSESKSYRLGLSIEQQHARRNTDLDTRHGHASSDLIKGPIPNRLADTEPGRGSRHHMMTGGCPRGCGKHQICVVSAMGSRCIKTHPNREGSSLMKHFRAKSPLELKSFAIENSHHGRHHQMPEPKEEMQLSSDHVDTRAEARIAKRRSSPSLEQPSGKDTLSQASLFKEEDNDTSNFLSANKPGFEDKERAGPSPKEGHRTNLANYFMSLRKDPVVHQKVIKKLPECHREQLEDIMKRLTGWFVLLHAKYKEKKKNMADGPVYQIPNLSLHRAANKTKHHFSVKKELNSFYKSHKCHCVRSIIWEFKHLDLDSDKHIDHSELSKIEKNDMEPCVKPFIDSCDRNGDLKLTRHEWCCCFAAVRPPCFTHLRRLQSDATMKSATFVPHCDRDGYYEKRQCHKGICWCVDLNGNEITGTRTRGTPHCDRLDVMGHRRKKA